MPTMNDVRIPINVSRVKVKSPIFSIVAPIIMGTDNRKVNLVAAFLDKPMSLDASMVVPLLEKPGIIASDCERPIINA